MDDNKTIDYKVDEESELVSSSFIVLEFLKVLPDDAVNWLISKVESFSYPGGSARLTIRQVIKDKKSLVYYVGCPTKKLFESAELMQMKKKYKDGTFRDFTMLDFDSFENSENPKDFFSSSEKHRIIKHELESIRFLDMDKNHENLPHFFADQAIFAKCKSKQILTYFPLHEKHVLERLAETWVKSYHEQPIDAIQCYFGDSIAMYFGFLGCYTKFLIPPGILGLLFYALSFVFDNNFIICFCVFNLIWATIFLETWKRKSSEYSFRWGSYNHSVFDEARPEFYGNTFGRNPVTGRREPYCNPQTIYFKYYFVTIPIITFALLASIVLMLIYFWLDQRIAQVFSSYTNSSTMALLGWISSMSITVSYGILIYVVDYYYRRLAVKLNNWENYRLQSSYDNNLIFKLVSFNFVNYFMSLFYLAFYLQDFELLKKNLATLLITWQLIQQVQEAVLPYLAYKLRKKKRLDDLILKVSQDVDQQKGHQIGKEKTKEEYLGTFDDFLELFLQFGYVFLFSAIFPCAAFCALVNNLIEIRTDAFKLCQIYRRSFSATLDGIGAWLVAFEVLGIVAVITNCALVALTPQIKNYLPFTSEIYYILFFVAIEHLILFAKGTITYLVPSTPLWIKTKLDEINYQSKETWKKQRKELQKVH